MDALVCQSFPPLPNLKAGYFTFLKKRTLTLWKSFNFFFKYVKMFIKTSKEIWGLFHP